MRSFIPDGLVFLYIIFFCWISIYFFILNIFINNYFCFCKFYQIDGGPFSLKSQVLV